MRSSAIVASLAASVVMLFAFASSSASALSLGVQWQGNHDMVQKEMVQVGKSGADQFRMPLCAGSGFGWTDLVFQRAAENGVTILPTLCGRLNPEKPTGVPVAAEQAAWSAWVAGAVKHYGYNGTFWQQHPELPPHPVTTWETWNEPNFAEMQPGGVPISPASFGEYLAWVGPAIQNASLQQSGQNTEVLVGGILTAGTLSGTEAAENPQSVDYSEGLAYLQNALSVPGASNGITGVAIHPYAVYPKSFPGKSRIAAYQYVVEGFRSHLNSLGLSAKSLWITEVGWAVEAAEPKEAEVPVTPAEQAALLTQAIDYAEEKQAAYDLRGLVWYNFRDVPDPGVVWQHRSGLRAYTGSYRPAYFALQQQAGVLRWEGGPETSEDNNFAGPRPVASGNGRVDIFWRTPTGSLGYRSWMPLKGNGQGTIPGDLASPPHAYAQEDGAVNVFWRTPANQLGHAWKEGHSTYLNNWSSQTVPVELGSDPHAIVQDNGAYDAFWRTPSGNLGHFWYSPGGPGASATIPANLASDPAVGAQDNGTVDVFWRTPSGNLGHYWYTPGSGSATAVIPADLHSEPHLIEQQDGRIDVFWKTSTDDLGHFWYVPGVGSFTGTIPADLASDPYPVFQRNGTYDIFWRTSTNDLGHFWYSPGGSGSSATIPAQMASPPHAVAQSNGLVDVFWRTPSNNLGHYSYSPATGSSTATSTASIAPALTPTVATEPAVTQSGSAFLKGKVNPRGSNTTYQFEYGKTTAYGSKAPASPKFTGGGTSPISVSELVKGLEPGVTYHYRVVASNEAGTTVSGDATFTPGGWYEAEIGGSIEFDPEISSRGSGRLDVFAKGTNHALYHRIFEGGSWQPWQTLSSPGPLLSAPSAVSWGANRIDVVARVNHPTLGNTLWHWFYISTPGKGGSWGSDNLGGNFAFGPAISSWGANRLDVFARGATTGKLFHKWWDGVSWSGWEDMGGSLESGPGAVSWGHNRIDVVAASGGVVKHWFWAGAGWLSDSLEGSPTSAPEISAGVGNRLDVYSQGSGGTLRHKTWANGWGGWTDTKLPIASGPGAVSWGAERRDVVGRAADGTVKHWYWIGP